jgi:hypothetical protein
MNKTMKYTTVAMMTALVAACAGDPGQHTLKSEAQIQQSKAVERVIDTTPDWYMKPPVEKETVFSVGVATSPDLQLSVDKAIMSAKRTLADRLEGRLSSLMKSYITELGQGDNPAVVAEIEQVTKSVLADVNVAGYEVNKKEIRQYGTQFRTYVLLSYKTNDANQVLVDRLKSSREVTAALKASKAYRDLDKETNAIRDNERVERDSINRALGGEGLAPISRAAPRVPVTTN